jgi:hypothetical protein
MALVGAGRCAKAVEPMNITPYCLNFFSRFAESLEVRVNGSGAKKRTQGVEPVADALEDVVKVRLEHDLPPKLEKGGREKGDGNTAIGVRPWKQAWPNPVCECKRRGLPEEILFPAVDHLGIAQACRRRLEAGTFGRDRFRSFKLARGAIEANPFARELAENQHEKWQVVHSLAEQG